MRKKLTEIARTHSTTKGSHNFDGSGEYAATKYLI